MGRWLRSRQGDMVEGALTLPVMILITLALVNLALAGFASVTASMAADYAARVGSVAQVDPAGRTMEAAQRGIGRRAGHLCGSGSRRRRAGRQGGGPDRLERAQFLRLAHALVRPGGPAAGRAGAGCLPAGGLVKWAASGCDGRGTDAKGVAGSGISAGTWCGTRW